MATVLPKAVILTKAHRAVVSIMAKGSIVAWVLPLRSFLFSLPTLLKSCKYYTVQFREKYSHSNITVNRNYYGQRLASKLPVFDHKSYFFFKSVQLYQYFCFLFSPFSDEAEIFLPKYSQAAILHSVHFRRVVNQFPSTFWKENQYLDTRFFLFEKPAFIFCPFLRAAVWCGGPAERLPKDGPLQKEPGDKGHRQRQIQVENHRLVVTFLLWRYSENDISGIARET